MANHPSAAKRHRQAVKRTQRNIAARSRLRSAIKKVRALAASGDAGTEAELKATSRVLEKAASKGIIHRNSAARRISRLARLVNRSREGAAATSS